MAVVAGDETPLDRLAIKVTAANRIFRGANDRQDAMRLNPTQGASQIVRVGRLWALAKQLDRPPITERAAGKGGKRSGRIR